MAGKPPQQQQLLPGQIIAQQAAQQQQQKMMAQQQQQQGAYGESNANTSNCVTLIYFPLRWIPPAPCRVQYGHSHLQGGAALSAAQGRPAYCE